MPLWGNTDVAANSVKYGTELTRNGPLGSGNAAKAANNTALYGNTTPDVFGVNAVVGQFAVSTQEMQNTAATEFAYVAHAGWNVRIAGTGGAKTLTASGGSGFANGESVTLSNGTVTGTGILTANATGNLVSAAVTAGGAGFVNATMVAVVFNREQHLASITVGGTPTGYSNTDVIRASNGSINAIASVSTNATGGFATATIQANAVGLWSNSAANSTVVFTVFAANGAASAGSGATFTAGLGTSTGGTVTVTAMGGRAGRIQYETIVAMGSISSTGNTIPFHT